MRRKLFQVLFLLFILIQSFNSLASHLFGGELLYTHLTGNTYRVTLTVYADCNATGTTVFESLYSSHPTVNIYDGTSYITSLDLAIEESGTEVSPICSSEISNTRCNGGTLPGVRRFKYSNTVTLPRTSPNWAFIFAGAMPSQAGRSGSITNIAAGTGTTLMQLRADLDNSVADNSSPNYSSIPTPFYCINLNGQYNQGAIDADGDSLSFSLVPAVDAATQLPLNYANPYSGEMPLNTQPGTFAFSSLNGQVSFTPAATQDALVVCRVSEYRNGVLIGTSEREMTFVVLDNCQGTPPSTTLDSISGGSVSGSNVLSACVGNPHLSFAIALNNPDADKTTITNSALPGTSTLSVSNNNTATPVVNFDWATGTVPVGIYTFFLTIQNDHCPLAQRQTIAYTINITPIPELSYHLLSPTQCAHKAAIEYDLKYGYTPRSLSVMQGSSLYKVYSDTSGIIIDSLPSGTFTVIASSDPLCAVSATIAVPDSGSLVLDPVVKDYCINAPKTPVDITPVGAGAVISWFENNGTSLFYAPEPNTSQLGSASWYFTEDYQQCHSGPTPVTATVHPLPIPAFADSSKPQTICLGDTIYLNATGGTTYTWTPADQVLKDDSGRLYVRITTPVTIQLKAEDSYGCADSTIFNYKDIQYCCLFSYPNAFTPNGDGRNDGFGIVTYGNMVQYNLIIYNRWGQQVFHTNDPREYWDGTYNGTPCEMGTYVYYFKAQCLTGNKEESKGNVTLIR